MLHRRVVVLAIALLGVALTGGPARAWTRTHVSSVQADVDATRGKTANVILTIDMEVEGGWLSAFDVDGIDVVETPASATFVNLDEPSERFSPTVTRTDTGVSLGFERKSAPHRGRYRVTLPFESTLTEGQPSVGSDGTMRAQIAWTLPAWESAMEDVHIRMRLPEGSKAVPIDPELRDTVLVHPSSDGRATVVEWVRVHLPQTVAWTVVADVPHRGNATVSALGALAEGAKRVDILTRKPLPAKAFPATPSARSLGPVATAVLITLLLAFLKLRGTANLHVREHVTVRYAVPMATFPRITMLLCAAAAAVWTHAMNPQVALGCLALIVLLVAPRRARMASPIPSLGAFRAADDDDIHRATAHARNLLLGVIHPADITTVSGAVLAGLFLASALAAGPTVAPLWFVPLAMLIVGTRFDVPRSAEERLLALASRGPLFAGHDDTLMVFETHGGHFHDVRRRVGWGTSEETLRARGLLHMDIVMRPRGPFATTREQALLVVVTERDSDADQVVRGLLPGLAESRHRRAWGTSVHSEKAETVRAALWTLTGQARASRPSRARSSSRRAA